MAVQVLVYGSYMSGRRISSNSDIASCRDASKGKAFRKAVCGAVSSQTNVDALKGTCRYRRTHVHRMSDRVGARGFMA